MLRFRLRASMTSCARATWCSAIWSVCSRTATGSFPQQRRFLRRSRGRRQGAREAGIGVVGIANNVHYGETINGSVAQLDRIGVLHTGAGEILQRRVRRRSSSARGVRFGFIQRSSVYWPTNHEARKDAVGIAVIKGHTAYQIPTSRLKPDSFPPNRPACRLRSSPGRTPPISRNSRRTLPRCVRRSTCWSRHVIGVSATTSCNT